MILAQFIQFGLPLALLLIMFSIGLKLQAGAFVRILRAPRALFAGLTAQMLLVPLSALALVVLLEPGFAVAMGLIILSLSPGGITSNLFSYLARGDVALSVSLTLVASLITPFSLPLLTGWALSVLGGEGRQIDFPVLSSILRLLVITLLPLLAAMALQRYRPALARRLTGPAGVCATLLFATVIAAMLAMRWSMLPQLWRDNGVPVVLMLLLSFSVGWLIAAVCGLQARARRTIMIESGLQNGAMALVITDTVLAAPAMSSLVIFYGIAMLIPALIVVARGRYEAA
ncbi:bile acid:sodium symporter family protein [Granulosicoccaceae sp. 1_MG-2023]|nr:bile acid:sodium symporter family protein [Granulosicoccaceae sp. 1_MG-2023]